MLILLFSYLHGIYIFFYMLQITVSSVLVLDFITIPEYMFYLFELLNNYFAIYSFGKDCNVDFRRCLTKYFKRLQSIVVLIFSISLHKNDIENIKRV